MNQMIDKFKKIDNAISDLKNATFDSHKEPLKKLGRILFGDGDGIVEYSRPLVEDLDIHDFIAKANNLNAGMSGSDTLSWPEDEEDELGLKLLLMYEFVFGGESMIVWMKTFYCPRGNPQECLDVAIKVFIEPLVRDFKAYIEKETRPKETRPKESETMSPKPSPKDTKRVFIVHGHDEGALQGVARFIEKIGLTSIILHEQVNKGQTIIEKIEKYTDVGFAVVLLTPDDKLTDKDSKPVSRARQNVILELGYFLGGLGRDKVCVLKKGGVEMPSDFEGVVWVELDKYNGWQMRLIKELKAAGYSPEIPQ